VNDLAAGRTPQDTIAGKAEVIAKLAIATEQLQRSERATAIDKQWDIDRKTLFGTEQPVEPKKVSPFVAFVIIMVFIMVVSTPPLLFLFFTWNDGGSILLKIIIFIVLISSLVIPFDFFMDIEKQKRMARAYKEAEQLYHRRRRDALSGKDDELPVDRHDGPEHTEPGRRDGGGEDHPAGVGMEEARIIRQRLAAGETREALAEEYQIQVSTVRYIEKHWMYEDA
jgi:hypothetical protein